MSIRTGCSVPENQGLGAVLGLAFAAGLALGPVTAGPALAGSYTMTEEQKQVIPVAQETKLIVKNTRGKSFVVGKKEAREVTIRAEKLVRAKDSDAAKASMKELEFTVETNGHEILIVSRYPGHKDEDGNFWGFLRGLKYTAEIDYTIEVPSRLEVQISSTSGDVQVTSVENGCVVEGSSGDVLLKSIGGDAVVEVSSGDVEILEAGDVRVRMSSGDAVVRDARGSLDLAATSGDVQAVGIAGDAAIELSAGDCVIERCAGSVTIRTASGDATLVDVSGSVWTTAGSGDVAMNISPVGSKEFVVNTASGNVIVSFDTPDRYGFALDVSTASGSIEGDMDIRVEKVSRRILRGVVGNGQSKVKIETASGNIVIHPTKREDK
jgi:DUF4097 and DUF4098 domain-containing protein YvlB